MPEESTTKRSQWILDTLANELRQHGIDAQVDDLDAEFRITINGILYRIYPAYGEDLRADCEPTS